MEYDQSNPNHQRPDYYSYTPETEQDSQDSLNIDPSVEPLGQYNDALGRPLTQEELYNPEHLKDPRNIQQLHPGSLSPLDKNGNPRKLREPVPFSLRRFYENQPQEPELHPDLAHHVGSAHDSEERDADQTSEKLTAPDPFSAKVGDKSPEKVTEKAAEKFTDKIPNKPIEPPKTAAKTDLTALNKTSDLDDHATAGQSLPEDYINEWEPKLGHSLKEVKIVSDDKSDKANKALGSRAFNVGKHIYFGAGEYNPSTPEGKKLIAHEVGHLKQPGQKIRRKASDDNYQAKIAAQKARLAAIEREKERQRLAAITREKARQAAIRKENERKAAQRRSQELRLAAQRARAGAQAQQIAQVKEQHPHQPHPVQDKTHPQQSTHPSANVQLQKKAASQPIANQAAPFLVGGFEISPSFNNIPPKDGGSLWDMVPKTGFKTPQQMQPGNKGSVVKPAQEPLMQKGQPYPGHNSVIQAPNRYFDNAQAFAYDKLSSSTPFWSVNPEPWGWGRGMMERRSQTPPLKIRSSFEKAIRSSLLQAFVRLILISI